MNWLGGYFFGSAAIMTVLVLLGLSLETIDQFIDQSDKDAIKSRIDGFRLFIADLSTPEKIGDVVRARRGRMRRKLYTHIH